MPTGYTDKIKDDISFEEFALDCAREFGLNRDSDISGKPRLLKVPPYYVENIADTAAKIDRLQRMTVSEKEEFGRQLIENKISSAQDRFNEKILLRGKYEQMLAKVYSYVPPTSRHTEFKEFMISQIKDSIEFDCKTTYYLEQISKWSSTSPMDAYKEEVQSACSSLEYYENQLEKEKTSVDNANEWIIGFCNSLGIEYES